MDNDDVVLSAPLFATMEETETRGLLASMSKVELARGDVLFSEGQPGDRLYVISEGKIKLGRSSSDGRENLIAVLGPGEMFGELSLFDPGPRTARRERRLRLAWSTSSATTRCCGALEEHPGVRQAPAHGPRPPPAPHQRGARRPRLLRRARPRRQGAARPRRPASASRSTRASASPTTSRRRSSPSWSAPRARPSTRPSRTSPRRGWVRREGRAVVLLDLDRLERRDAAVPGQTRTCLSGTPSRSRASGPAACAAGRSSRSSEWCGELLSPPRARRRARPRPGESSGRTATPTALRACTPASPKISPSSVAGAVDHGRLAGERRVGGDEADDLDDARDLVERPDLRRDGGERVERGGAGERRGHERADEPLAVADLAGRGEGALDEGQLAGRVDVAARAHRRDVGRDRGGDLGELEPELGEALPRTRCVTPVGRLR